MTAFIEAEGCLKKAERKNVADHDRQSAMPNDHHDHFANAAVFLPALECCHAH